MNTLAEQWLVEIQDFLSWMDGNGTDPHDRIDIMGTIAVNMLSLFEQDDRVTLTRFPHEGEDVPVHGTDFPEIPKMRDILEIPEEMAYRVYGRDRAQFADGSALLFRGAWVTRGIHASRLAGGNERRPFLFMERLKGMEGFHLPPETLH